MHPLFPNGLWRDFFKHMTEAAFTATPTPDHWHDVTNSSNVAGCGILDGVFHTLFSTGTAYSYPSIAPDLCCEMASAKSPGTFFAQRVRPTKDYNRLTAEVRQRFTDLPRENWLPAEQSSE